MGGPVVAKDPVLHTLEVRVINLPYEFDIQQIANVFRREMAFRPGIGVIAGFINEVRARPLARISFRDGIPAARAG